MYVSGVQNSINFQNAGTDNSHEISSHEEAQPKNEDLITQGSRKSLFHRRTMKQMDWKGQGQINTGYSQDKGTYVEFGVKFDFGPKSEPRNSSSHPSNDRTSLNQPAEVDSRDRDFDNR